MKTLALPLIVLCSMTGCTLPLPLDDRLPFSTIEQIQQQASPAPLTFEIDPATRTYVVEQRPSSLFGYALGRRFEVGKTLSAYLKQAEVALQREGAAAPMNVKVRLVSAEINYTYSLMAALAFRTVPDWIDMTLRIETDTGVGPHEWVFEKEIDRTVEEVFLESQPDRIVTMAIEAIVLDYLKKI